MIPQRRFLVRFALLAAALLMAAPAPAFAQEHEPLSWHVDADGVAHLRLHAPEARDVRLVSWSLPRPADQAPDDGPPAVPMTRQPDGTWTYAWGPLEPDLYEYRFRVDGLHLRDPKNLERSTINWSVFPVPTRSGPPRPWEVVPEHPRGTIHHHTFASTAVGASRDVVVYTPPGYEQSEDPYPVLFLLHGSGGDAGSWTTIGRAQVIMDNHIAAGGTPRILVMPDGHVRRDRQLLPRPEANAAFYGEFFNELLPLVERHYRVATDRPGRALAGLSMGGGHTLALGLRHPELFSILGIFSSGVGSGGRENDSFTRLAELARNDVPPPFFWVACGRHDFARDGADRLVARLSALDLPYSFLEDESSHSWNAWRGFLPRLLADLDQASDVRP